MPISTEKKSSHWSLGGKIKILKIFADDVIGTKFDQKYFQCLLSEYLTNFESFPPENGIVEVSLKFQNPQICRLTRPSRTYTDKLAMEIFASFCSLLKY